MLNKTTIVVLSFSGHQHLLSHCLQSIKDSMPSGYHELVLVWDDNVDWYPIDFDLIRSETGVNFRLVKQSSIHPWPDTIIRWGWIKQQLAKLMCHTYVRTPYTWIVDGDVLLKGDPNLFDDRGVPLLRFDPDRPVPECYKPFMTQYLGFIEFNQYTYVGSTMLFDNSIVREIDKFCFDRNGKNIIDCVDETLKSGSHTDLFLSEFEIYGHHVNFYHPTKFKIEVKNWNYSSDKDWKQPIQVMWDRIPISGNLDEKKQWLMAQ